MIKFRLFYRSDKSYLSVNNIFYLLLLGICAIALVRSKLLGLPANLFDKISMWLVIVLLCGGVIVKIINLGRNKRLDGIFNGYLYLDKEAIYVNDREILLDGIQKIYITNNDYHGKLVEISRGNIGPCLSNGVDNSIEIFLLDGSKEVYLFELVNEYDFKKIKDSLVNYHIKGLMSFDNLAMLLRERKRSDKEYLRKEIERKCSLNELHKFC